MSHRVIDLSRPLPPWIKQDAFPDGQVNFTIVDPAARQDPVVVYVSIISPTHFLHTLLLLDCLGMNGMQVKLRLGYVYGGRSDRQFGMSGIPASAVIEALKHTYWVACYRTRGSLRFVDFKDWGTDALTIEALDPRSPQPGVTPVFHPELFAQLPERPTLIFPDQGAVTRLTPVLEKLGLTKLPIPTLRFAKSRDATSGNPTLTMVVDGVPSNDVFGNARGRDCVIVDDLCDGGRTYTGLASLLKSWFGARSVELRTTHAIYSKGVDVLRKSGIDRLVTTNSFPFAFVPVSHCPGRVLDWRRAWEDDPTPR